MTEIELSSLKGVQQSRYFLSPQLKTTRDLFPVNVVCCSCLELLTVKEVQEPRI
jgi:hypothetical protein